MQLHLKNLQHFMRIPLLPKNVWKGFKFISDGDKKLEETNLKYLRVLWKMMPLRVTKVFVLEKYSSYQLAITTE